jgi:hypothetical protein
MRRVVCALAAAAAFLLTGCGGGGGGGSSSAPSTPPPTPPPTTLNNFATVTVDQGPAGLGYTQSNVAYVSVTLCAPGSTTNCQTIDHVQVDTGSVGLRIFGSVLNSSLLSALPFEIDSSSNPVGECYQYIDGYVFGSVRQADMTVGGESVADMPLQILSDGGQFTNVPSSCSAGGGSDLSTVPDFGANGIIGIGVTETDCGAPCTVSSGQSSAIYYDCPSSGCGATVGVASSASAPFQQLPNPVAAFSVDNNGSVLTLPSVPAAGESTITGTLYFGIGTQTNNGLGSATIYTATNSSNPLGAGVLTVDYSGTSLTESFLDSGSSLYFFEDSTITACTNADFIGLYCPASPLNLTPTIIGLNGATVSGAFTLYNAQTQFSGNNNAAVPGVGGNPAVTFPAVNLSDSFDYGLPFFYGRSVYTAIEGRSAGGTPGPFFAF